MKTYKYYKIDNNFEFPTPDEVDVVPYSETIIGVNAEDHSTLEFLEGLQELTFEEITDILEESHLNKELNKELVNCIREKYTIDDEIAVLKKYLINSNRVKDSKQVRFEKYLSSIKNIITAKKIKYGLKKQIGV